MWWCHTATTITSSCNTNIQLCLQHGFLLTAKQPETASATESQGDKGLLLRRSRAGRRERGPVSGCKEKGLQGETQGGRLQRWQTAQWNWSFINSL